MTRYFEALSRRFSYDNQSVKLIWKVTSWRTRGGESDGEALRLDFDWRLTLQFRGSVVTSDAGLLAYRELDDALGLSAMTGHRLADARTGKNGRHALVGMLRQAVFGRLAGYEDVNDAERLRHDPAMRWIVGGKAAHGGAASASQMGRFETRWLTGEKNLLALAITRCSCSTNTAIWNAAPFAPATSTAPKAGRAC
jgi:Transposase DDE domain group 1